MKRKINLIEGAMKHSQIIISLILVLLIYGIYALATMPRNEFPDFTIRQGLVVGVYPGATSQEVEDQLTRVVENYIFGFEEVNKRKTYSLSSEGKMIIFVELNDNVQNSDKFWSKLRLGLNELKMQLPQSVLALIGTNDFGDTSALLITMSSDKKSNRELKDVMKLLEAEIRKIESVSKMKRYGEQDEKIFLYIQQDKLDQYNINLASILASFKLHEAQNYAGQLDNGEIILPVYLPPRFENEDELAELVVYSDPQGNIIRLKDVVRIERKYDEPDSYILNNGNSSLLLSLEMQKGNNIVQYGREVIECLEHFKTTVDDDVEINIISNQPEVVDHSISHFLKEFLIAILSVIAVTMILLPFRVASVAAVTIPISILITMGIMQAVGLQLDIVSLAGLIVVLGMVVDNAIVVIDNHVEKLDHGLQPWEAAWKAATELVVPVFTATLAIIAAFMPMMLFLKGMAGDFVGSFPLTITIALTISMIIAMFLVPIMCYIYIKRGLHSPKATKTKKSFLDLLQNSYNSGLSWTFRHPVITIILAVLSIVAAIVGFGELDQKMFPAMDRKQFAVEIELPTGSSLDQVAEICDSLETILLRDDRITNVASFVGTSSPRFYTLYKPHMPAKNFGQLMVNTISEKSTPEIVEEYTTRYKNSFPNAHIKWKRLAVENFDLPIEIRIAGNNIEDLKATAEKVKEIMRQHPEFLRIKDDWNEGQQALAVELNNDQANKLGYSKSLIAAAMMANLDGLPVTSIWEKDYPVDVILSREDAQTDEISDLNNLKISSLLTTESLPLRAIGKLKPIWTEGTIVRRNGERTLTVMGDMSTKVIYNGVFNKIRPEIDELELPEGVKIYYGGEVDSMKENYPPLGFSLGVSIILIFFILLFQFKTLRRASLIMSTMLLSLLGAVIGLLITGYPFSLTAFIGLIGLMGITIRNGIILIDYAMQLVLHEDHTFKEAAIAAGQRRMRPIFLTSMAAAIGVVPMIASGSTLWGPLGTVICFGLISGMIMTLFTLPVMYWKSIGKEKHSPDIPKEELQNN